MVGAWICNRTARVSCIVVPAADEKTIVVWRVAYGYCAVESVVILWNRFITKKKKEGGNENEKNQ